MLILALRNFTGAVREEETGPPWVYVLKPLERWGASGS